MNDSKSMTAFQSIFDVRELNEKDEEAIEKIFIDHCHRGAYSDSATEADSLEIKRLTRELKAIKRQELILIGERIAKARLIFRKYKDRSFRMWLLLTFGTYKTGYNYLAFYDLYSSFPSELKQLLKSIPVKASYVLASKKAPIDWKIEIVQQHAQESAKNLITLIQGGSKTNKLQEKRARARILDGIQKKVFELLETGSEMELWEQERIRFLIEKLLSSIRSEPQNDNTTHKYSDHLHSAESQTC